METIKRAIQYLANLQWTEQRQHPCLFCTRDGLLNIVHEDDQVIVVKNIRLAGSEHWLILPIKHIRDIESLTAADIPTLKAMDKAKNDILATQPPRASVHCGYHRGRRRLVGPIFWPDIISIHHLHLHVIVEPRPLVKFFKYPPWLPLMWKSDKTVLRQVANRASK